VSSHLTIPFLNIRIKVAGKGIPMFISVLNRTAHKRTNYGCDGVHGSNPSLF
jgi:hypothetical protein